MPFYDNWGKVKASSVGLLMKNYLSKKILKKISNYSKANNLLELGPGNGHFSQACISNNFNYTCADINLKILENIQIPRKQKVLSLIPPIPFASNSFGISYASNFLEHMVDFRAAYTLIKEMVRVTKPNGLICHRVPDAMSWGMHFWNGDYTHSFVTTKRRVAQLYIDNNIHIEGVFSVAGPFLGKIAKPISLIGKLIPSWIVDHGANPLNIITKRVYSLKTTFLAGFLIIGRKVN